MPKPLSGLQILTANRLRDGTVVFLTGNGRWSTRIAAARAASDDAGIAELERAGREAMSANIVVDPYLIAVEEVASSLVPLALRERRRVLGPSVGGHARPGEDAARAQALAA